MTSILGVGPAGIWSGGLLALLQSAAALGKPLAPALAPVLVPIAVASSIVSLAVREVFRSKCTPRPSPTGLRAGKFAVLAHDWGTVRCWAVATREEAVRLLGTIHLRRFAVEIGTTSLIHGRHRVPWREFGHAGVATWVDDAMRGYLGRALRSQ